VCGWPVSSETEESTGSGTRVTSLVRKIWKGGLEVPSFQLRGGEGRREPQKVYSPSFVFQTHRKVVEFRAVLRF
jgi:hypothetical protein